MQTHEACNGHDKLCELCCRRRAVYERGNADDEDEDLLVVACACCGMRVWWDPDADDEPLCCRGCGADLSTQSSDGDCPGAESLDAIAERFGLPGVLESIRLDAAHEELPETARQHEASDV